jgi:hypothetical protein
MWSWQSLSWSTYYLHGSLRLTTMFHKMSSWMTWIKTTSSCPTPFRSILIILSHSPIFPQMVSSIQIFRLFSMHFLSPMNVIMSRSYYPPSSFDHGKVKVKKAVPVTDRGGPQGCETSRFPYFLDNRLTMAVRLSALRAGRTLSPGWFLVLISVRDWVDPMAIVRLEGLGQLKNSMTSVIEPATFRLVA